MGRVASALVQIGLALGLLGLVGAGVLFFTRHEVLRIAGGLPQYSHGVGARRDVLVPMRDGVQLETQVVLPRGEGPWPTVLLRSPYNELNVFTFVCELFARNGYACVHQDVRGRMGSEGEWYPLRNEREDGLDTFAWLRAQDFQNGTWGLFGMSYLAGVQWAVADSLPDEVKTMVSIVFGVDSHRVMYEQGLFRPDVFTAWAALMPEDDLALWNGAAYLDMLKHRPARLADEAVLGIELPWYRAWVDAARADDPFWMAPDLARFRAAPTAVTVPVLMLGGYFDPFFDAQLHDFRRLATRAESKLVVGPWHHLHEGAADFPLPDSLGLAGQWKMCLEWLDHHLQGAPRRHAGGVIETYDVGAGAWRQRLEFPPRSSSTARFFFAGFADARGCPGGELTRRTAFVAEPTVSWTYDPEEPYPSEGGASALSFAFRTFPSVTPGARARSSSCGRDDVVRFVSAPLEAPLHLAGSPQVSLQVSSTAEDTAFGFELQVNPPGDDVWYHVRQSFGVLSLQARTATPARDGSTRFVAKAWPIEWTFPAGSRLKVEVRSSSFPLYAAHPNVAGAWGAAEVTRVATQTLHPGAYLDLPLRPGAEPVLSGAALGSFRSAMACTFDIEVPGSAPEIVQKAQQMITDAGGSFTGDTSAGSYQLKIPVGSVAGSYTVTGNTIRFDIEKKPMLVPCSAIETFIRDRLGKA